MTTSVRYKFVKNVSGAAFIDINVFPVLNDGDDKKFIFLKRILTAADIGTAAGQSRHALGIMLDVMSLTTNVLWVRGDSFRPLAAVSGVIPYLRLDDRWPDGVNDVRLRYALGLDNTIRVIDAGAVASTYLAAGDIVTAQILIGSQQDSADSMN
jgi:hypothetical protein